MVSATNISSCVILGSPTIFQMQLARGKKTLLHNHQYLPVISLLDPQIKDYKLQSPRLHAKTIIKIRSLSQTYNCDYAN